MTKRLIGRCCAVITALTLATAVSAADQPADKKSAEANTFYYMGTMISRNLKMLSLSDSEAEQLIAGLRDALAGEAQPLDAAMYDPKVRELTQQRAMAAAQLELEAGKQYVAGMAQEKGAVQTDSGLVYLELAEGDGAQPDATSQVKAHYRGTLRDGTVFDSSYDRGQPLTIGLNQVIPCWTEGIAMMKEGGKARLTCPGNIAYGERAQGAIPANAALTFEVELLEIVQ